MDWKINPHSKGWPPHENLIDAERWSFLEDILRGFWLGGKAANEQTAIEFQEEQLK